LDEYIDLNRDSNKKLNKANDIIVIIDNYYIN